MEVELLDCNPTYSELTHIALKTTFNMNRNKSRVLFSIAAWNIWAIWCHILLLRHKGLACLHGAQSLPCHLSPPQLLETSCQQSLSRVTWLWINSRGNSLSFFPSFFSGVQAKMSQKSLWVLFLTKKKIIGRDFLSFPSNIFFFLFLHHYCSLA